MATIDFGDIGHISGGAGKASDTTEALAWLVDGVCVIACELRQIRVALGERNDLLRESNAMAAEHRAANRAIVAAAQRLEAEGRAESGGDK